MGLDQYMFRVSKVKGIRKGRSYERDDSLLEGCIFIPAEEIDEDMYVALKPFATPIKMSDQVYNMERIIKDYNLSDDAYIGSFIGGTITVTSGDKRVSISDEEVHAKYITTRFRDIYAVASEEIYYWRKAYEISEFMNDAVGPVENCGFYAVNRDVANDLLEYDSKIDPNDFPETDSNVMYHEWF
jgi:hypothetical protein